MLWHHQRCCMFNRWIHQQACSTTAGYHFLISIGHKLLRGSVIYLSKKNKINKQHPKTEIVMVEPQKKCRDLLIWESVAESASLHLYRAQYDQFFSLIVTRVRIFYRHHILSGLKLALFLDGCISKNVSSGIFVSNRMLEAFISAPLTSKSPLIHPVATVNALFTRAMHPILVSAGT